MFIELELDEIKRILNNFELFLIRLQQAYQLIL
jgi:hypothetical protein